MGLMVSKKWITKNRMFLLGLISLLIVFSGIRAPDIISWISGIIFPKPDYTITSLETPRETFFIGMPLLVSEEYYIEIKLGLRNTEISPKDSLRFNVIIENKGKKSLQEPRLVLLFIDPLGQIRGIWNRSLIKEEVERKLVFEYILPPLDQKVLGFWKIATFLHDDANGELTSYSIQSFTVKEKEYITQIALISIALGFVAVVFIDFLRKMKKLKKRKSNTSLQRKKRGFG